MQSVEDAVYTAGRLRAESAAIADVGAELRDLLVLVGPVLGPDDLAAVGRALAEARRAVGRAADVVAGLDPAMVGGVNF